MQFNVAANGFETIENVNLYFFSRFLFVCFEILKLSGENKSKPKTKTIIIIIPT